MEPEMEISTAVRWEKREKICYLKNLKRTMNIFCHERWNLTNKKFCSEKMKLCLQYEGKGQSPNDIDLKLLIQLDFKKTIAPRAFFRKKEIVSYFKKWKKFLLWNDLLFYAFRNSHNRVALLHRFLSSIIGLVLWL